VYLKTWSAVLGEGCGMSKGSVISLPFYVVVKFSFPLREEQAQCVGEWDAAEDACA